MTPHVSRGAISALSDEQVECLALAIYWEARGESLLDRRAVAHVALNRTVHPEFPDTVCDVVKQGGEAKRGQCQFSWWCDGRDDTPREAQAWEDALALAEAALSGRSTDPTGGAIYFHHRRVHPKWAAVKDRTAGIGPHIFYR
jgi:spore germination cell wall hydrolase CwlJ-like protein